MGASISWVVATITMSISGACHGGAPIGGGLGAGMRRGQRLRAPAIDDRSIAPTARPPALGRVCVPIRPHPTMAILRGIGSPPVRITDLCDVSLILPAYNEAATIASTIRETGQLFPVARLAL